MINRVYNFNPGPSTLPLEVLQTVQEELLDYKGTGMSVMEISHRSPEYDEINNQAITLVKNLMDLGDNYHVIFVGGGASTQFAHIPLNFLAEGKVAAYVDTGTWSAKAIKEAQNLGNVHLAASSKDKGYTYVPMGNELDFPNDAVYLHLTSNNTIKGTQFHKFPDSGKVPLICDMSSDILSHQIDFNKFALFYAGAQKNLGPSGVTMVVLRDDMLERINDGLPTFFDYRTHTEKKSLFNTPPSFTIYVVKLILEWIQKQGGLKVVENNNKKKKDLIYNLIDANPDYFHAPVLENSRSWMNIVFRLSSEDMEQKFISEAKVAGLIGLKGHRSVGGIRVSLYNAMTLEGTEKVAAFMENFKRNN